MTSSTAGTDAGDRPSTRAIARRRQEPSLSRAHRPIGLGGPDAYWAFVAARAADAKLGVETLVIDVGPVLAIVDHFVITTAANSRQVKAIADEIQEQLSRAGGPRQRSMEGLEELQWVLLDYGDFVVHIFQADARGYYALERLWSDRPRLDWQAA